MVFDFDSDGRAEMMCKTAPGSVDGTGRYVNQAATDSTILAVDNHRDWRNRRGRVAGGQEYLTVFDGQSGRALHTIFYEPNRDTTIGGEAPGTFDWDTDHRLTGTPTIALRTMPAMAIAVSAILLPWPSCKVAITILPPSSHAATTPMPLPGPWTSTGTVSRHAGSTPRATANNIRLLIP